MSYDLEFTSKKSEVKLETENEIGKFERKKRQVERITEAEQIKVITSEDLQNQLLDQRWAKFGDLHVNSLVNAYDMLHIICYIWYVRDDILLLEKLSDEIEALKIEEKSRLADLTQYNNQNNLEKLIAMIEKVENESNEILIDNLIKAQDEVDFMSEETTKLLNLQIEKKLQQIQKVEKQTSQLSHSKW